MSNRTRLKPRDGPDRRTRTVGRKFPERKNAMGRNRFAKASGEEGMKNEGRRLKIVFGLLLCLIFGCLILVCGCTTPNEYELDTTPKHNGAHWIGGE